MAGKTWEELTIQNNFIFGKSMETSPKICKWLLEKILHMKIRELTYPEREKSIDVRRDSKGIRLDVFVQEADGESSYDLEMQVIGQDDLPKRIRYYQGLIDMDAMDIITGCLGKRRSSSSAPLITSEKGAISILFTRDVMRIMPSNCRTGQQRYF